VDWFRHYSGLHSDPKLTLVAEIAGVHHCFAVAVWCALLEHASPCSDRGNVSEAVQETGVRFIAIGTRIGTEDGTRIVQAMIQVGLIKDGRIAKWNERQFSSDNSTSRVQRFRDRTRNVSETRETVAETHQNRSDIRKKESPLPPKGERTKRVSSEHGDPAEFEAFWLAYPRKENKGRARTAFAAAAKKVGVERVMAGVGASVLRWRNAGTEARFIPLPSSWLNGERWSDQSAEAVVKRKPDAWQTL